MKLPPPGRQRDVALAILLAGAAALFRLPLLGDPPDEIFDEVYHAKTALQYLRGENPTEWVHPPTAKLIIAAFVWLLGYDSFGWRIAPALAGVALAPVFFFLARRALPTERGALIASTLLLADGVYLVQSRTAMTNIFAVLFQVGAALAIVRASTQERLPVGGMMLAGLCLGLALSTRWTSLWAAVFLGIAFLFLRGRRALSLREIALVVVTWAVVPLLVYVASYIPWMLQGGRIVDRLRDLWPHTKAIWDYHSGLRASHPYFSDWKTWPWLIRPTWYYFNQSYCWVRGIVALGNPALWWASVPVSLAVLALAARSRDGWRLFSAAGFFALYLPWGVSPRTLNYSHYLFEAIPYACLSLGYLLDRAWDGPARPLARGYVLLVVLMFVFFLPFFMGLPVPVPLYYHQFPNGSRPWTWMPTWV